MPICHLPLATAGTGQAHAGKVGIKHVMHPKVFRLLPTGLMDGLIQKIESETFGTFQPIREIRVQDADWETWEVRMITQVLRDVLPIKIWQ